MKAEELLSRIEQVRRRLRWLLACDGIARLLAAGVTLFALAALVDWWVRVPALLRGAASVLGVLAGAAWTQRRIIAPLKRNIPLQEVAVRLDVLFPETGHRLAAAVERFAGTQSGAAVLWDRVVAQTLVAAEKLPWRDALSLRRPARSMIGAALLLMLLGAWAAAWPPLVTAGAVRFAWPFGSAQWPRRVQIEPLTRDLVAAAGEPVIVQMRVVRGAVPQLRAWTVWRELGRAPRRELMSPAGDGAYSLTVDRAAGDAEYWFEADDDSTADRPGHLRQVTRPALVSASARFTPPAYAAALGETVESLADGRAEGLEGSFARIEIELSKPAGRNASGRPAVHLTSADGRVQAMSSSGLGGRRWHAALDLDAPLVLDLWATDVDGLSLPAAPRFELAMRRDAPPMAAIVRPTRTEEVTPEAEVEVRVVAEDDVDVAEMRLQARVLDGADLGKVDLWSGSARKGAGAEPARVEVEERWPLAKYRLTPGTAVEYWAEAQDNYERAGARHPPVRSAVMRLRVISVGELAERLRDELVTLGRRLQRLREDQESNRRQTAALLAASGEPADRAARSALDRQRTVAAEARAIADALRDAADRLKRNHDPDAASRDQSERAAADLRAVAEGPMTRAADALRISRPPNDADAGAAHRRRAAKIEESTSSQAEAVARLDRLIGGLQRWTDYDGVVQKTRDLLDRQEAVARATAAAARELSGRGADSLSAEEQARLRDAAQRQDDLARELAELLKRVDQLAQSLERKDHAASDSLARAGDAAQREQVRERMTEAAEAVRENNGARAEDAQQAAQRGLAAMLESLSARAERELANLSKEAAAAAARLDKLIRTQETLSGRTQSAARQADAAAALPSLSPQQRTLEVAADSVASQIDESVKGGGAAADAVRDAAARMGEAQKRLDAADGGGAAVAQVAAIDALHKASGLLEQVQAKAEEELAAQAIEKIRHELEAVRSEQSTLADAAAEIQQRQVKDGRLSRVDGIRLNRAAQDQAGLGDRVDAVRKLMAGSTVFDFVCGSVSEAMRTASAKLRTHDVKPAIAAQREALSALVDLLRTLDEAAVPGEQSKYASEEEGGSGGGSGGEKEPRPIPALAELKMLRVLQNQVNEGTRAFDERVPAADARSEDELAEARALGERQRKLRELARKVIAGAKGD